MINQVEGDYLEFGVFKGARMTQAYETAVFLHESVNKANKAKDPYLHKISAKNLETMRFIGFDSFEGLPKAGAIDVQGSRRVARPGRLLGRPRRGDGRCCRRRASPTGASSS